SGYSSGPRQRMTVVGWIITLTAIAYAAQMLFPAVTEWFGLSLEGIQHGRVWSLVTYAFMHARNTLLHIIVNMLVFYMIGPDLMFRRGSRELIAVYLASAVFSGVA